MYCFVFSTIAQHQVNNINLSSFWSYVFDYTPTKN